MTISANNWDTHDFTVRMLDWSPVKGSKLVYRCRRCGRNFHNFSAESRNVWAVDEDGRALENAISDRWLSENCPRLLNVKDDEDRRRLYKPNAA